MGKKIILFLLFLLGIESIFYYFLLKTGEETNDEDSVKKMNVTYYVESPIIAFTIEGEKTNISFPQKGEGYLGESVTCTNGITGVWNNDTWKLELSNLTTTTNCTINFVEHNVYLLMYTYTHKC